MSINVLNHPLAQTSISKIRDKNTKIEDFRKNSRLLAKILITQALSEIEISSFNIETPVAPTIGYSVKSKIMVVPIMRAGLSMVDPFLEFIPNAHIVPIGVSRNEEDLSINQYYNKAPKHCEGWEVFILDPMLATGNSAIHCTEIIKKWGVKKINLVSMIGCPEGVKAFSEAFPDINIYLGNIDEKLNSKNYIVPGLGDAGDRFFGE